MFASSLPPIVCSRAYLCYLCLVAYSGVQHMCFCFVCIRLVYPMLPVSLGLSIFIVPSVFSNVYLRLTYYTYIQGIT